MVRARFFMTTWISLLRGVNLAGHNRIKMDALRAVYVTLGFTDVQTLLQSGNVVFRAKPGDRARLGKRIEDAIEAQFGFRCAVVLRSSDDLRKVVAANPFATREDLDGSKLGIHFLAADPPLSPPAIDCEPEELHIVGRELFIYYPNGMGRPKLSLPKVEKALGTFGTMRNWNTVRKLLEMAEGLG